MGDQPITGKYHENHSFSDKENIYAYEKAREALQLYPQRTSDIVTVESGLEMGVPTHIIMPPTIYGVGTGLFNKLSIQVPTLIRTALKLGHAVVVGEGKSTWDYVHVADLAKLYELLVLKIIAGEEIPSGEKGIIFAGTGRYQWIELSRGIADALFKVGAIKTKGIEYLDIPTAAEKLGSRDVLVTELGFASKYVVIEFRNCINTNSSRTQSDIGHELGWMPQKTSTDFKNHFLEEVRLIIA
jgi:nucleoside-diphosphate-sugar epimerase